MKTRLWLLLGLSIGMASCQLPKSKKPLMGGIAASAPAETKAAETETATADSIELPAPLTDRPEQILRRTGFTISYNQELRLPNWVAWHLTADHTTGPYKRAGVAFQEDEDVPEPRVNTYDYQQSGYDRGHMCPSADNRWNEEAQRQCFLMTNICPQLHALNDGDWKVMEEQCRDWAEKYGDVYIVCGPILLRQRHKRIGTHKVTVPEAFFKVVLCTSGTPKAIGFIYRNQKGRKATSEYVNTVDEVERITGIDFFAALPDSIEARVERSCDLEEW